MDEHTRDTVGKISTDLSQKTDYYDKSTTVVDQRREMQKDYEKNVLEAIGRGMKQFTDDFFVVVEIKKERLMANVIRNYFFPRETCPTPNTDQIVYHYVKKDNRIDFIWAIPDKQTCELMRSYPLEVLEEEKELLDYVLKFYNGELLQLAKRLNHEQVNSPLLKKD